MKLVKKILNWIFSEKTFIQNIYIIMLIGRLIQLEDNTLLLMLEMILGFILACIKTPEKIENELK